MPNHHLFILCVFLKGENTCHLSYEKNQCNPAWRIIKTPLGRKYGRNTKKIKCVGFMDSLKDYDTCSYFIAFCS